MSGSDLTPALELADTRWSVDALRAQLDAMAKLTIKVDGPHEITVDASALATNEYGPTLWTLSEIEPGIWSHWGSGESGDFCNQLRAIASCYLDRTPRPSGADHDPKAAA